MVMRKRISRRRWKARMHLGKAVPELIFCVWPDLAKRCRIIRFLGPAAFVVALMPAHGADLRIPRERHVVSKPHLTAAPAYEPYFQGLPNKLNPKEPPVERPAGLP